MKRLFAFAVPAALAAFVAVTAFGPAATRTTTIGSIQVVQVVAAATGDPQVSDAAARTAGLADLAQLRPDFKNMSATRATFAPGVTKASTPNGFAFETSQATNVWLVEYSGPPQSGWEHVEGYTVVDAKTGRVLASGISGYND